LLERVLELVRLDLTDRGEEGDRLTLEGAVLLEVGAVGLGGRVVVPTAAPAAAPAAEVVSAATGGQDKRQRCGPSRERSGTSLLTNPHRSPPHHRWTGA